MKKLLTLALILTACREANRPPTSPWIIQRQYLGTTRVSYEFQTASSDSDGDAISYRFSWGDGDTSDWSLSLPGDSPVTMSHSWQDTGGYTLRAEARDEHGVRGEWSSSYSIGILDKAPDFSLIDLDGNSVTLWPLLAAGPVYLVLWDLPCVNSINEIDELQPVYDSLAPLGFQMLAISVDKPADADRVRTLASARGWRCPVLLDSAQLAKNSYHVIIKPTAVLVGMDTAIAYQHTGYRKGDWQAIEQEILKCLPPRSSGN